MRAAKTRRARPAEDQTEAACRQRADHLRWICALSRSRSRSNKINGNLLPGERARHKTVSVRRTSEAPYARKDPMTRASTALFVRTTCTRTRTSWEWHVCTARSRERRATKRRIPALQPCGLSTRRRTRPLYLSTTLGQSQPVRCCSGMNSCAHKILRTPIHQKMDSCVEAPRPVDKKMNMVIPFFDGRRAIADGQMLTRYEIIVSPDRKRRAACCE